MGAKRRWRALKIALVVYCLIGASLGLVVVRGAPPRVSRSWQFRAGMVAEWTIGWPALLFVWGVVDYR